MTNKELLALWNEAKRCWELWETHDKDSTPYDANLTGVMLGFIHRWRSESGLLGPAHVANGY